MSHDLSDWRVPTPSDNERLDSIERTLGLLERLVNGYDAHLRQTNKNLERIIEVLRGSDESWARPWEEDWTSEDASD